MLPRYVSSICTLAEKSALPAAQRWKENFYLGRWNAKIDHYKKTWSTARSHTYAGFPIWGALIGEPSSTSGLRFRESEPGGSESIKTTGFNRGR